MTVSGDILLEVWFDSIREINLIDVNWKKVTAMSDNTYYDELTVREARAEYYTLIGKGVRATLVGSKVGFDQSNTRYKLGYHSFECWPDTVDPRGAKGK